MAKTPNISSLASGFRSSHKLNENFDEIKEAFENTLSRDGSGPNHMEADLDMNGQRIYNLPEPTTDHEPARYIDIREAVDEASQAAEDAENAKLAAEAAQLGAEAAEEVAEMAQEASETARDEAVDAAASVAGALGVLDPTRAEVATVTIPESVEAIRTTGYSVSGDGGGGLYVRVETEPTHPGKVQSADGAWWELQAVAVSPRMFGATAFEGPIDATADGFRGFNRTQFTDALAQIKDAISYAQAVQQSGRAAYLFVDGYYYLSDELQIDEPVTILGVGRDSCGLRIAGYSALKPGLHNEALGTVLKDFEICADDRGGSDPGDSGHTGTCITNGDYFKVGDHPPASLYMERMKFTRAYGARVSHALAIMGNTRAFVAHDILIDGLAAERFQAGIMAHWGADGAGVGSPITKTYHPMGIVFSNTEHYGCGRIGTFSGCCDVEVTNGYADHCTLGWNLSIGDEGDVYAAPEFVGKVYSKVILTGQVINNLKGIGLAISGRGTSKINTDQSGQAQYNMPEWGVVDFSNNDLHFEEGEAEYHVQISTARCRSFQMHNVRTRGATYTGLSVSGQRLKGSFKINGNFDGSGKFLDTCDINLDDANFTSPITAGTRALEITGRSYANTLAADAAANATTIELTTPFGVHIFPGDPIITTAGTVYATGAYRNGCTTIGVTPLPAAVSSGSAITLDHLAHNIRGRTNLTGGEYGLKMDGVRSANMGGIVRDFGTHGHYISNSTAVFTGVQFENGGLNRALNGSLVTYDVILESGADVLYVKPVFGINSAYITYNVRSTSEANGGRILEGVFGSAITGAVQISNPTYDPVRFEGCRNLDGSPIALATGMNKPWTPEVRINDSTAGIAGSVNASATRYERKGRETTIWLDYTFSNKGSSSGPVQVLNLPVSALAGATGMFVVENGAGLSGPVVGQIVSGRLRFYQQGATGPTQLTDANITNSTRISGTIVVMANQEA